MPTLTRSILLAAIVPALASCYAAAPHVSTLPPTDRSLWAACQPTLARICRATFEPTWDSCLEAKRGEYVYRPSFEARRAFLLSEGCPPTVVNTATRRSREAVMPKAVTPKAVTPAPSGGPGPASPAPPPTAATPPDETPS